MTPEVNLTPEQLAAVDVGQLDHDVCVVAGPGSGKTLVLVEYFRRLVDSGVSPLRILAITFTEKSAHNMKHRLVQAFQHRPDLRRQLQRAYVSTVHGFCTRLLRENAVFAGVDPEFRVLDERQANILKQSAIADALDQMLDAQPAEMRRLMTAMQANGFHGALLDVYEAARAGGVAVTDIPNLGQPQFEAVTLDDLRKALRELASQPVENWKANHKETRERILQLRGRLSKVSGPEATLQVLRTLERELKNLGKGADPFGEIRRRLATLLPKATTELHARERRTICDVLIHFDRLYRERKQQRASLDFSDLEEYAVTLLERDIEVQQRIRSQFDQILMDEFQDTNPQQSRLLTLLRPSGRFYAVGDINQSIYGFRHSDPEIFHAYRAEASCNGGRVHSLVENWRSRPEILAAVSAVTRKGDGIEPRALVSKKIFPPKEEPSVEVIAALGSEELEARWVARRIRELEGTLQVKGRPARFGDMAVLVRNSEVLGTLSEAFETFGVPHAVNRGKGFHETREVRDLTHLLHVLVNPLDEISMAVVLRSPLVEVSDEALLRLKQLFNLAAGLQHLDPTHSAGFLEEDLERLLRFRQQLERWRAERDYISIDRLLLRALDETGYVCESGGRGEANLEKFLALAREASGRQPLAEFVSELEQVRASDPREPDVPLDDTEDTVKLMTVHAAKGLEFPIVFLAALHKRPGFDRNALLFSPKVGLGACWFNPATGKYDAGDWFQYTIKKVNEAKKHQESSRLFYVATTRAEEHLVFSFIVESKPQQWAGRIADGLKLDLQMPGVKLHRPEGASFVVRVLCTNSEPERPPALTRTTAPAQPQLLARPSVTEQHDSGAAVTSVALFAACPRRYYLGRYLGWGGARRINFEDLPRHRETDDPNAGEMGQQVHALLAGAEVESPAPESVALAEAFQQSPLGRRAKRACVVEREFDFLISVEDVVLRGRVDLWFEDQKGLVLVDYKTDETKGQLDDADLRSYELQLRVYALALERFTGRLPDEAYIYLLRPNVVVPVDLLPLFLEDAGRVVREFREAQSTLHFPLMEGEHCRRCPFFRGLCPATL